MQGSVVVDAFNEWELSETDRRCAGINQGDNSAGRGWKFEDPVKGEGEGGCTGAELIGDYVSGLIDGTGKRLNMNGHVARINTPLEGCLMLLAVKIAVAVQDAVGAGFTLVSERRRVSVLRREAWEYLESDRFSHDVDLLGLSLDVDLFLDELKRRDDER